MSKNKLKIILGLGLLLLSIVIYFYPELFAVAGLSIAFAPVIDLYDDTAHNEEGSGIWWAQRIDKMFIISAVVFLAAFITMKLFR